MLWFPVYNRFWFDFHYRLFTLIRFLVSYLSVYFSLYHPTIEQRLLPWHHSYLSPQFRIITHFFFIINETCFISRSASDNMKWLDLLRKINKNLWCVMFPLINKRFYKWSLYNNCCTIDIPTYVFIYLVISYVTESDLRSRCHEMIIQL